ncbi:MAG: hypothetical protein QOH95_2251 [Gaiellaceae bacterium]|nr:hypothetical protein [Gaiellaceae bacterium]
MRAFISACALALAALSLAAVAGADPGDHHGNHGKDDGKGEHGQKGDHGKRDKAHNRFTFSVVTTDNGSCSTPWATDTVMRTFTVKDNHDGTFAVTRRDRGVFVTLAGASPGACETTGQHGKTVRAGVTGKLEGFLRGTVTGGTFNPNATCTGASCGFTDTFLATFFGTGAQFSCFTNSADCSFNFEYEAAHHQSLLFRHWQDKGKGAGTLGTETFRGDIADA